MSDFMKIPKRSEIEQAMYEMESSFKKLKRLIAEKGSLLDD